MAVDLFGVRRPFCAYLFERFVTLVFAFLIAGRLSLLTGGIPGVLFEEGFGVDELFPALIGIQPPDELLARFEFACEFTKLVF